MGDRVSPKQLDATSRAMPADKDVARVTRRSLLLIGAPISLSAGAVSPAKAQHYGGDSYAPFSYTHAVPLLRDSQTGNYTLEGLNVAVEQYILKHYRQGLLNTARHDLGVRYLFSWAAQGVQQAKLVYDGVKNYANFSSEDERRFIYDVLANNILSPALFNQFENQQKTTLPGAGR